jgi:hypothetical protein
MNLEVRPSDDPVVRRVREKLRATTVRTSQELLGKNLPEHLDEWMRVYMAGMRAAVKAEPANAAPDVLAKLSHYFWNAFQEELRAIGVVRFGWHNVTTGLVMVALGRETSDAVAKWHGKFDEIITDAKGSNN